MASYLLANCRKAAFECQLQLSMYISAIFGNLSEVITEFETRTLPRNTPIPMELQLVPASVGGVCLRKYW